MSFKLNWSDELSLHKQLTSHLLKRKLPQLWGGSTWLTSGYGHLVIKATLCWGWLDDTERLLLNDQVPGFLASGGDEFNAGPETGWIAQSFCVIKFY